MIMQIASKSWFVPLTTQRGRYAARDSFAKATFGPLSQFT